MDLREPVLSPQPWTWRGRRVLIEHADEGRSDALAAALRLAGYAVAICSGPTPGDRCPLAGDTGCAAAVGADAVLSGLGVGTPEAREALAALRLRVPRTRLLIETEPGAGARWPELLDGCDLVAPSATPDQLVDRIRVAIQREERGAA